MTLDWRVCSRARLSRDARFDGKFFIGVRTSGVYCRSICPARTAMESNCSYYPSAAAAADAGFRPCLRCRPECSPGTPGWLGTSNTVSRALRLIGEGALEQGGVDALAEHLGIGSRHLRRLFLRHLGATPSVVANTRRLHFAKKLIDETALPMSYVALVSGFGCVRRFNTVIRETYKRTPTQIRALAHQQGRLPEHQYMFRLHFRPPYDWNGMLVFLQARTTPGVEDVEEGSYSRTIALGNHSGYFVVSLDQDEKALSVRIQFDDPHSLLFIIERIRAMFDLDADWLAISATLRSDPLLMIPADAAPGVRVPGCWNGFELAACVILGQQMSLQCATFLAGRIAAEFGEPIEGAGSLTRLFPTPTRLSTADLTGIGVPEVRARTIRALAIEVAEGRIRFERVGETDSFLKALCGIPGFGREAAQEVAMRALRETDAFPYWNPELLRATGATSVSELKQYAEAWRPWRAYAAMHLLQAKAAGNTRAGKGSVDY